MSQRPDRKPDHLEILTADQIGQALCEYLQKHRGLNLTKKVVHQFNDFYPENVMVSIYESDE